ncbi:hypothetical protein [Nonomuraea sp. NPDC049480]|uniref:hypothetical protein n=1 Tax=Nonomuraea sp. NPDC049480 TaxID=3364353 RepID=UPI00379E72CB
MPSGARHAWSSGGTDCLLILQSGALRRLGSPLGLAIHTPSSGGYEPAACFTGTPQKALDLVCDLYTATADF